MRASTRCSGPGWRLEVLGASIPGQSQANISPTYLAAELYRCTGGAAVRAMCPGGMFEQ
jgi:hypothetical protein